MIEGARVTSSWSASGRLRSREREEKQGGSYIYKTKGQPVTINSGRINWWGRSPDWEDVLGFRGEHDAETPVGEWNTLEVIVDRGAIQVFLNGIHVNESIDTTPTSGQLQIQSEGAELFVRRVDLLPLEQHGARSRNAANPEAVAAIANGANDFANAAWWGFDPEDATAAVQSAIDSGAKKVLSLCGQAVDRADHAPGRPGLEPSRACYCSRSAASSGRRDSLLAAHNRRT